MGKKSEFGFRLLTETEVKSLREDMKKASMYMKAEIVRRKSKLSS